MHGPGTMSEPQATIPSIVTNDLTKWVNSQMKKKKKKPQFPEKLRIYGSK